MKGACPRFPKTSRLSSDTREAARRKNRAAILV
jgi:hypothetical protein